MSVKNRLNYGIYPIASRRHEGRSTNYYEIHDEHEDAVAIVTIWIMVPFLALLGPIFGTYDYGTVFLFSVFMAIVLTIMVKV